VRQQGSDHPLRGELLRLEMVLARRHRTTIAAPAMSRGPLSWTAQWDASGACFHFSSPTKAGSSPAFETMLAGIWLALVIAWLPLTVTPLLLVLPAPFSQ